MSKDLEILITNDDGIDSEGIRLLAQEARAFGKVTVVAPASQCSGMSHHVTFDRDLELRRIDFEVDGVEAYTLDATPADCVRASFLGMARQLPDVVLSGINDGANVGCDILYSGTIGAGMEALLYNVKTICFSTMRGGTDEVTRHYLGPILGELLDKPRIDKELWNVNFPACPLDECKGVLYDRVPDRKPLLDDFYETIPVGDDVFKIKLHTKLEESPEPGSDMDALYRGYVAIGTVRNLVMK
ncbi:MAG: 5'/3'-nucleotidase SurE [Eubacterium sp.]|nr:5'/3'-nucleotidase SurE [Eubacterium sp.]